MSTIMSIKPVVKGGGALGYGAPQTAVVSPVHKVILWSILGMYSAQTSTY